ncbi:MAG: hypothetical protein ACRECY_16570 [Phyllobacterium sp.]
MTVTDVAYLDHIPFDILIADVSLLGMSAYRLASLRGKSTEP